MSEKQIDNKKMPFRFSRGDSRINRKGRPPKLVCIPDKLRAIGSEPSDTMPGLTKLEEVCRKIYEKALEGDLESARFIAERTEGKVRDIVSIEHEAAKDIVIVWPHAIDVEATEKPAELVEGEKNNSSTAA